MPDGSTKTIVTVQLKNGKTLLIELCDQLMDNLMSDLQKKKKIDFVTIFSLCGLQLREDFSGNLELRLFNDSGY